VNTYLGLHASTLLAAKVDVAEEGIATDSLPLEQQGERVVWYSATATGQAQEHIAPAHRFRYRSIAPKRLGVH